MIAPPIELAQPSLDDRRLVHRWLTTPGIVERMMGPPLFPEIPVPDFETFCADYTAHYWTHDDPAKGRLFLITTQGERVGCITQNEPGGAADGRLCCEIDIWLAGPEFIGRGCGRAAIITLCQLIAREFGVEEAFLQPSLRNPVACAAYAGAGFTRSPLSTADASAHYGVKPDYADAVFFVRRLDRPA